MCKYFSCYAIRRGHRILFTESDDHSTISDRAGLGEMTTDDVAKIECIPDGRGWWDYRIDEATRPEWIERWTGLRKRVIALARKVDVYHAEYHTRWDALYAEYQPRRDALYAEYQPRLDALRAEYQPRLDALRAEYQPRLDAISAEYVAQLATITGYVPKRIVEGSP